MTKYKSTIINEIVMNAADIMESKIEFNELVIQQYEKIGQRGCQIGVFKQENRETRQAIEHMRKNAGCWN